MEIYSSNYYLHIKPLRLLHISREVKDSEEASSSSSVNRPVEEREGEFELERIACLEKRFKFAYIFYFFVFLDSPKELRSQESSSTAEPSTSTGKTKITTSQGKYRRHCKYPRISSHSLRFYKNCSTLLWTARQDLGLVREARIDYHLIEIESE